MQKSETNKEGNGKEILQMRLKTNPLDRCWDANFSIMEKWLNSLKKQAITKKQFHWSKSETIIGSKKN